MARRHRNAALRQVNKRSRLGVWPSLASTMHVWPDEPPPPERIAFPDVAEEASPRRRYSGHPALERRRVVSSTPARRVAIVALRGDASVARRRIDEGEPVGWGDGLALLRERLLDEAAA
jgi:hypothetical protein